MVYHRLYTSPNHALIDDVSMYNDLLSLVGYGEQFVYIKKWTNVLHCW